MGDELASALLKSLGLRVLLALTGETSRKARGLASLAPASAALLAQGLTAAVLLGALQKGERRINLQLECDGPLRGLFADSDPEGHVRGYVKNPHVQLSGKSEAFRWRPALGNSGFLSVLRDKGEGEYYRSAVKLEWMDLARDLERFFETSEQLPAHVQLQVLALDSEPLGLVAGLLVQPLPDGDRQALAALGHRLRDAGGFLAALQEAPAAGAASVLKSIFPGEDLAVMSSFPVEFTCGCSRERVVGALLALGRAELADLLEKEGQAEASCQFCSTRYVIPGDELRALLTRVDTPENSK